MIALVPACRALYHATQDRSQQCAECRAPGGANDVWYGQLQLLFTLKGIHNQREFAFIRWFTEAAKPAHAPNFKLKALKWETTHVRGIRGSVPKTDVVGMENIIGLCFIQPDPLKSNTVWLNHWVGNVMNEA